MKKLQIHAKIIADLGENTDYGAKNRLTMFVLPHRNARNAHSDPAAAQCGQATPSGFFLLWTPLLPVEVFKNWSQPSASETCVNPETYEEMSAGLRKQLYEIATQPAVLTALRIASPTLVKNIDRLWEASSSKLALRTQRAIVRHLSRMCFRPTPFGAFATCSAASITRVSGQSILSLKPLTETCLSTRLDFRVLDSICRSLIAKKEVRRLLTYRLNPSLRKIGSGWNLTQWKSIDGGRSHHILRICESNPIRAIVQTCKEGTQYVDLVDVVRTECGNSETDDDAERFIDRLISEQFLLSSLEPPLTGESALKSICRNLPKADETASIHSSLDKLCAEIESLQGRCLCFPESFRLGAVENVIKSLGVPFEEGCTIQTDAYRPLSSSGFSEELYETISRLPSILCAIGRFAEPSDLQEFRKLFLERFGRRWVPLSIALDEGSGVRLGSKPEAQPVSSLSPIDAELVRSIIGALARREPVVRLDSHRFPVSKECVSRLPESFSILCRILATENQANADEPLVFVQAGFGPSSLRLFGRFLHLDDSLKTNADKLIEHEKRCYGDAILAEIVDVPSARGGNVLTRPVLREYELVLLGTSGANADRQIPVSDIDVTIAEDGTILLWSRRLQKRIIPRLASAYGYNVLSHHASFQFLCALQHQHGRGVPRFTVPGIDLLPFVPRIVWGRVVLSPASWLLEAATVEEIRLNDQRRAYAEVQRVRKALGLPRWIEASDGDGYRVCDLDNPLSVDAMLQSMKGPAPVRFREYVPMSYGHGTSANGVYISDVVIPFQRDLDELSRETLTAIRNALDVAPPPGAAEDCRPDRKHAWTLVKLFAGRGILDEVLTRDLPRIITEISAIDPGLIWFFSLSDEPQPHLKISIKIRADVHASTLERMHVAFHGLLVSGSLEKIQFQDYVRESQRYAGAEAMSILEEISHESSKFVLASLVAMSRRDDSNAGANRYWLAIIGADLLLNAFRVPIVARRELFSLGNPNATTFLNGPDRIGNDLFRTWVREAIEMISSDPVPSSPIVKMIQTIAAPCSMRLNELAAEYRNVRAECEVHEIVASVIDTHVNRSLSCSDHAGVRLVRALLFNAYRSITKRPKSKEAVFG